MARSFCLAAIILSITTLSQALLQQSPPDESVKLYSYGDLLRAHKIPLTEGSLVRALNSAEADVRYLAAMKLAEDKAITAIPAIEAALARERVPRDQVNMALALGLLGDQAGPIELKKICADKNFVPEFRLYAVRYMFDLHSEDHENCLAAAEEILESKDASFGDRISALSLLPRFQDLTEEQSQTVLKLLISNLSNIEPVVRMAASNALAGLRDASAIPYFKAAIPNEKDDAVRSVFEKDLEKLQNNPKK